jgi:hypothetical protein
VTAKHAGVHGFDHILAISLRLSAQTARHNDFAIFSQCFTNGVQAFSHCIVNKTTGIDDDQIGPSKCFGGLIALCT